MWRFEDSDRVLTEPEWEAFATGLDVLLDAIKRDGDPSTGIEAFDQLSPEQKIMALAEVARAMRRPEAIPPILTAALEATVAAVLRHHRMMVEGEAEDRRSGSVCRQTLLDAMAGEQGEFGPIRLPKATSRNAEKWDELLELFEGRFFMDDDYTLGGSFLDLPPEKAEELLERTGIDRDYFLDVPDEPTRLQLAEALALLNALLE
jgi:hypothetical protein